MAYKSVCRRNDQQIERFKNPPKILLKPSYRRCPSLVRSFRQRGELPWMARRKKGVRIANGATTCCRHMVHSTTRGNQTELDLLTRATHTTLRKQRCHTNNPPTIKQSTSTGTWTSGTIRRQNEAVVIACWPQYEGDHEALFSASTITPWHISSCQRPRPNYILDSCTNRTRNWGIGLHRLITTDTTCIKKTTIESTAGPMDIDIQNAQFSTKKSLPDRDNHGKPRCFYCNGYDHVKKYCRKFATSRHHQNAQIQ